MPSFSLLKKIQKGEILPCYFFYGDEIFLARKFVHDLRHNLISSGDQSLNLERFTLEESSWRDIIDLARTVPFFFSPWRIIVVETSWKEDLTSLEEKILKDYFVSPSQRTILVIIFSGKIDKSKSLFTFFSSLPSTLACLEELRALKPRELSLWMDEKLSSLDKIATPEAKERLIDVVGNDLQRLENELEKLSAYIGEKRVIDLDDVNQVSGWVKTFIEWELANSLERADLKQSLVILDNLFAEGTKPVIILGVISNFFRDILLAKVWLKEKKKDKKQIFRELKPQISEKFGGFYVTKLRNFFSFVEGISFKELNRLIASLEQIDLKMKTTDISPQTLLEGFFCDYCRSQKKEEVILREQD